KESEDEEEIMTSMQIGPPIESSQEMRRLDIGQQIMPGRTRQQTRDATQLVEENLDDFYQDCALMSAIVTGQNNEAKTFQEAWYHNDQEKQQKWRTVIRKEFQDMIKRGVWVNVNRSSIPEGRKLIGSKWVFKEKRDGRFRARLVCLGYSQIPGVDFSDNYAPVGNDVTFRIVMVLRLMFGFHAVLLDVETAFLYGKLEEEIYMEIPLGYKEVYQEAEKGTVFKL
ncbi:MAG: reverse transcriptase domain-containing protein, partial [Waterburya sp.]